jgi:hypothetical protein
MPLVEGYLRRWQRRYYDALRAWHLPNCRAPETVTHTLTRFYETWQVAFGRTTRRKGRISPNFERRATDSVNASASECEYQANVGVAYGRPIGRGQPWGRQWRIAANHRLMYFVYWVTHNGLQRHICLLKSTSARLHMHLLVHNARAIAQAGRFANITTQLQAGQAS